MIKHLKHNKIDKKAWDNCIDKSFNGLIYAYSWYLDLVHDDWDALVENDYERVMPLTGGKKFGVSYLYQPYFTQQLGIFSRGLLSPDIVMSFIDHIPSKYKYYEINLNSFNWVDNKNLNLIPNKNHLLDLIKTHEKIKAGYSGQTKRNLKKSGKFKLTLMKNVKPEAIINLFRENRGKELDKWNDRHYTILRRLMYEAFHKGKGNAYGVFTETNEMCAGAFFMKNNNRLVFLFSGSNAKARETSAMTFMLDAVIEEHSPSRMVLDFEGSNDENLARFYKGFGAKEITYPGLVVNKMGFPLRQLFNYYRSRKKG